MASADAVSQNTQDFFGSYRLAFSPATSVAATGNTVAILPILSGGIGNGAYIIRRITVSNPANAAGGTVPSFAGANLVVLTSSDGNTSNAVTTAAGQTLGNVTAVNTWQDLTLVAGAATTAYQANTLFVKLNSGAVANGTLNFSVWGDVVNF